MIRIGLIGGPGTGKSTQCAHFFSKLKEKSIPIEQVQEWVREAINKGHLPMDNPWVQFWIYSEQKHKEDCLPEAIKYMITDSPTILSYPYALINVKNPEDKYLILKMYEYFLNDLNRYDYIFVCKREKEYLKDGTRSQTKEEALAIDALIVSLLKQHKVPFEYLTGTIEERTEIIKVVAGIKLGSIR